MDSIHQQSRESASAVHAAVTDSSNDNNMITSATENAEKTDSFNQTLGDQSNEMDVGRLNNSIENTGIYEAKSSEMVDSKNDIGINSCTEGSNNQASLESNGTGQAPKKILANGENSNEANSMKRGIENPSNEEHPSKKNKSDSSMADISLADETNNATPSSAKCLSDQQLSESVTVVPDRKLAATTINGGVASNADVECMTDDDVDYSGIIDPSFAELIKLEDIPTVVPLHQPALRDIAELGSALQIGDKYHHGADDGWKNDWSGNLQLYDKEVVVNRGYIVSQPSIKPIKIPFYDWVAKSAPNSNSLRGLELLFSYVYHMKGTPPMAKKIMAYSLQRTAETADQRLEFILHAVRRISYDPVVLKQDGWQTCKSESPEGALGGAFLIGRRIIWQRYEALVIAFVRDEEFGCLWKAVWVEDLDTFDLEAGELKEAMKKWDNKQAKLNKKNKGTRATASTSGSTRFASNAKFTVDGIENGIVLAASSNKASQGVLWPARVRHVAETNLTSAGTVRRNASKSLIQVVFLAPFWNGEVSSASKVADVKDPYSIGPLFELDSVEVSENNIQKYPFESLSIEQLQQSFRFLGLPKAVFSRFLDSHRLAVALKSFSMKCIPRNQFHCDDNAFASASLTESHVLSVLTPIFPQVVLNLPFDFVLGKLPHPSDHASISTDDDGESISEPTIDIESIIKSMSPPECFGKQITPGEPENCSTPRNQRSTLILSPNPQFTPSSKKLDHPSTVENDEAWAINNFASEFLVGLLQVQSVNEDFAINSFVHMGQLLASLISKLKQITGKEVNALESSKKGTLKKFLLQCLLVKGHGEEYIELCTIPGGISKKSIVREWRKACERIFKRAMGKLSFDGVGNGMTAVITDSRCNGHITANGSFERPVRIPAAIKGAKMAGAGSNPHLLLISNVEDDYMNIAEETVIPKAHKFSYVKRLKSKIAALPADAKGVPLTDDSEGEGGEDTMGSRGSYTAATIGVAAALKAADMVVGGQCVNVFCAVRPPGHHAGRELRPMRAISNGFCLLNAAACAAIYATTPQSQGGLGLHRVCVIDFDVHHGNGTQDILCSTYDPRFLYVSLHAGGAHINGFDDEDSEEEQFRRRSLGGNTKEGIFPGRCGDSSPHDGVLNIPLGQKVTATAVGTALISQVSPRVEEFSPDLIILSAGFDAHKNDPLGMGGLSAADFGSVTEVACQMANKACSGRILSVLEGGYGVPCCRPRDDLFLPTNSEDQLLELGVDLPSNMDDPVPLLLRQKLDKCHAEGFVECVKEHVKSMSKNNRTWY